MTEPTAVETGGTPVATSGTPGEVKADHDPRLTNSDLAPLEKQTWKSAGDDGDVTPGRER
jgi:hypothetical protein